MILEIHGGPFAGYGPVWSTEDQLYAAAGYVVVYANPRGSTSYGEDFANRIHHDYPSQDYDDLMSVVDAAIAKGIVDPNKLFVTGGSGGGLLTAWIVGKTDRFKAAVSQKPVINWTSEVLTTDGYNGDAQILVRQDAVGGPEQYGAARRCRLRRQRQDADRGHGRRGRPPHAAERGRAVLRRAPACAVPTALIRVPGASHGGLADRPSQLAAENAAILAWFGRYRRGCSRRCRPLSRSRSI